MVDGLMAVIATSPTKPTELGNGVVPRASAVHGAWLCKGFELRCVVCRSNVGVKADGVWFTRAPRRRSKRH